jgi:hypothetical protein
MLEDGKYLSCGSGSSISSESDPDLIRIQGLDDQKLKKKYTAEIFYISFLKKNCNLLMSKLQEKPSALKREHPAPDTDPGTPLNPDTRIRIHNN